MRNRRPHGRWLSTLRVPVMLSKADRLSLAVRDDLGITSPSPSPSPFSFPFAYAWIHVARGVMWMEWGVA
jgi:hypothetical protein